MSSPEAQSAEIARLSAIDLVATDVEDIKPNVDAIEWTARVAPVGTPFYRARILARRIENISEGAYPGPQHATLGRANFPGKPMLYCGVEEDVVAFEIGCKPGDYINAVHWTTTEEFCAVAVGYTPQAFAALGSRRTAEPATSAMAGYLCDVFTRRVARGSEHLYKISAAIAHRLTAADAIDGILYPSIALNADNDNVAIKPSFADRGLRFVRAEYRLIHRVGAGRIRTEIIDTAVDLASDGRILWRGRPGVWRTQPGERPRFEVRDGKMRAFDSSGNEIACD